MIPVSTRTICLFILLLVTFALTGCNEIELQSQWRSKPIVIDGSSADWTDDAPYFDKDSKVLVSIMNDENDLYIQLLTRNESTKRVLLRAGFTLWIDDDGGSGKKFGIQFPLAGKRQKQKTLPDHKPRYGIQDTLADSQYTLAILDGGTRQTMPVIKAAEMGIYVGLGMEQNFLIYELKVPFTISKDNKIIGIGFETGELERPAGKGASGGGGRGGGRGGGGAGGGRGGGKGGQHGGSSYEPIEIWAKVHLAEKELAGNNL